MPKIIAALAQHTPIMHFQHDEAGAALRGTELKSGLDAFLNRCTETGNMIGKKWARPEWHIGGKSALNYRVTVRAKESGEENLPSNQTPFFANMGAGNEHAFGAMLAKEVTAVWMVPDKDLAEIIAQWLPLFFLVNNFGTRKSKGFGSFTVSKITVNGQDRNIKSSEKLLAEFPRLADSGFENAVYEMPGTGGGNWAAVMRRINSTYRIMKSGNNFGTYQRSYLMKGYAYHRAGKTYSNDKRFMKQNLRAIGNLCRGYDDEKGGHIPDIRNVRYTNSENQRAYRYVRAMLGLADQFEFRQGGQRRTVAVADQSNEIRRFESPLLFKPIYEGGTWKCYIFLRKIPECMYNRVFVFSCGNESRPLATPSKEEFSLVEFMDFCCSNHSGIRDGNGKPMFKSLNLKRMKLPETEAGI